MTVNGFESEIIEITEFELAGPTVPRIQCGKTYCAAFCASEDLLAGSGNNAGCDRLQWFAMVEGMACKLITR